MNSLDPRVNRLERVDYKNQSSPEQLSTFEVFTCLKEGKPYTHTGIVHAPDLDLGFIFGKEQYSRRQTCVGIWVVATKDVWVSELTEGDTNVLDKYQKEQPGETQYDLFVLPKRGKQHVFVDCIKAGSPEGAIAIMGKEYEGAFAYNVWVVESDKMYKTESGLAPIWDTLPEKKFRDALAYRAGDKLKNFLESK